jgi:hypothetical protein
MDGLGLKRYCCRYVQDEDYFLLVISESDWRAPRLTKLLYSHPLSDATNYK